jgi:hypothetical protein
MPGRRVGTRNSRESFGTRVSSQRIEVRRVSKSATNETSQNENGFRYQGFAKVESVNARNQ